MTPDPYCSTCRGAGTVEPDAGATVRPWCRACSGTGLAGERATPPADLFVLDEAVLAGGAAYVYHLGTDDTVRPVLDLNDPKVAPLAAWLRAALPRWAPGTGGPLAAALLTAARGRREQGTESPPVTDERGPGVRACTWRGSDRGCGCCEDCPECVCTGQ